MARSNIPMVINLRQNTNDDSSAFGKYFAEVDSKEPLNLKGFAKHMTGHGKIADYQMCVLVLGQVVDCMTELLSQGQPVKLDGLGTFSPSVDGQKLGKNDIESAIAAGADGMINGIKINFTPENTKGEKLTSRAFKEQCVFEFGYLVESEVRTVNGKQRRVQKKTPLSYLLAPAADGASGGGTQGDSQSGGGTNSGGTNTGGSGDDDDERPGAGG
ncbi:MAG: hypothetical protein IJ898_05760 [Prevotella sp.]|nr:hypothetical protein [Prevotella sp.]